ncbi:MAG TPA: cytochrome c3 family protein [Thermoanaerobaculia bacterium]
MKLAFSAIILCLVAAPASGGPQAPASPTDEDCLTCHADPDAKRANGTSVLVAKEKLASSVHGQAGLSCVDCHADLAKVSDFPHAERLEPAQCASCHDAAAAEYAKGVHARAISEGRQLAARCGDCHGAHDILPSKDPASRTHHLNLPSTCERCHGDPEVIRKSAIAVGDVGRLFEDSIHGKALRESGLIVAPNCATCHEAHAILPNENPASKVARGNVSATCGSCHEGVERLYAAGVHGSGFRSGNRKAPVCTDCHTAHRIQDPDVEAWRLEVLTECGSCHEESLRTYRDNYHGQVTALGFARMATCSDCHRPHDIFPASDPRSTVSKARRVETCQKCHARANANFAGYDPHADPEDRSRNPLLHSVGLMMKGLLGGVFLFFGLHTVLWFPRSWKARRQTPDRETPPESPSEKDEGQ